MLLAFKPHGLLIRIWPITQMTKPDQHVSSNDSQTAKISILEKMFRKIICVQPVVVKTTEIMPDPVEYPIHPRG